MKNVGRLLSLAAIATGLAGGVAAPAHANLEVCNKSNQGKTYIAVAYPDGKGGWTTEGWLNLEEGECGNLIQGKLTNRYYYYFAETEGDSVWKGDNRFCVSSNKFTFARADKQCKGANSRWEEFRELDTGKETDNFTLDLE